MSDLPHKLFATLQNDGRSVPPVSIGSCSLPLSMEVLLLHTPFHQAMHRRIASNTFEVILRWYSVGPLTWSPGVMSTCKQALESVRLLCSTCLHDPRRMRSCL